MPTKGIGVVRLLWEKGLRGKPGPRETCNCGSCKVCWVRKANRKWRKKMMDQGLGCKKVRVERTDEELDRMAEEWLQEVRKKK